MLLFKRNTDSKGSQCRTNALCSRIRRREVFVRFRVSKMNCSKEQHDQVTRAQGAVSIRKTVLPDMAIPMLKIRRPNGRLIFNMEITIRR